MPILNGSRCILRKLSVRIRGSQYDARRLAQFGGEIAEWSNGPIHFMITLRPQSEHAPGPDTPRLDAFELPLVLTAVADDEPPSYFSVTWHETRAPPHGDDGPIQACVGARYAAEVQRWKIVRNRQRSMQVRVVGEGVVELEIQSHEVAASFGFVVQCRAWTDLAFPCIVREEVGVVEERVRSQPRPCDSGPVARSFGMAKRAVWDRKGEALGHRYVALDAHGEVACNDAVDAFEKTPVHLAAAVTLEWAVVIVGATERPVVDFASCGAAGLVLDALAYRQSVHDV